MGLKSSVMIKAETNASICQIEMGLSAKVVPFIKLIEDSFEKIKIRGSYA